MPALRGLLCCPQCRSFALPGTRRGGRRGRRGRAFSPLAQIIGWMDAFAPKTVLYSETQSPAANQTDLNTRFPKGRCAILPTVGRKIALTKQVWLYLLAADIGRSPLEPHACYWRVDSLGDRFWLAGWPGGDGKYLSERALQSKYAMTN